MLLALSFGATFAAKGYAGHINQMTEVLTRAFRHPGFSFVHFISPCVTFDHENILYDRLRNLWQTVPKDHDTTDHSAAMNMAMQDGYFSGVYYDNAHPTWADNNLPKD